MEHTYRGFFIEKIVCVFEQTDLNHNTKKVIDHFKRVGYIMDIMRQSAYLVVNLITV